MTEDPSWQGKVNLKNLPTKERYAYLVPEVFVHDPDQPDRTQHVIDQVLEIEQSRFPEDQAFEREIFEGAFLNTVPTKENEGKTNTVVLVRDPNDDSIFGFSYAEPAELAYAEDDDPEEAFHPERLANPDIAITAYISDTVFRETGSGMLKRVMPVLEAELYRKGYRYIERDSAMAYNFAPNLVKNNYDRILATEEHDSEYGPQMFIRMKIEPPQEIASN